MSGSLTQVLDPVEERSISSSPAPPCSLPWPHPHHHPLPSFHQPQNISPLWLITQFLSLAPGGMWQDLSWSWVQHGLVVSRQQHRPSDMYCGHAFWNSGYSVHLHRAGAQSLGLGFKWAKCSITPRRLLQSPPSHRYSAIGASAWTHGCSIGFGCLGLSHWQCDKSGTIISEVESRGFMLLPPPITTELLMFHYHV